jgi:hypothetical protein
MLGKRYRGLVTKDPLVREQRIPWLKLYCLKGALRRLRPRLRELSVTSSWTVIIATKERRSI